MQCREISHPECHEQVADCESTTDAALIVLLRNNARALCDAVEALEKIEERLSSDDDLRFRAHQALGTARAALGDTEER